MGDLLIALRVVDGRPSDTPVQRRAGGGWSWFVEGDLLDKRAVVAIVTHLVTTHALDTGDLTTARPAAETAALAAPYEEIPELDLAAVATAEGRTAEAQRSSTDPSTLNSLAASSPGTPSRAASSPYSPWPAPDRRSAKAEVATSTSRDRASRWGARRAS